MQLDHRRHHRRNHRQRLGNMAFSVFCNIPRTKSKKETPNWVGNDGKLNRGVVWFNGAAGAKGGKAGLEKRGWRGGIIIGFWLVAIGAACDWLTIGWFCDGGNRGLLLSTARVSSLRCFSCCWKMISNSQIMSIIPGVALVPVVPVNREFQKAIFDRTFAPTHVRIPTAYCCKEVLTFTSREMNTR